MILAGDIGGSKTLLALYEQQGAALRQRAEASYPSREFGSLEEIIAGFRADQFGSGIGTETGAEIDAACFGVAGPVLAGRADVTNLPWSELDETRLAASLNIERVVLLNDLEAMAVGMLALGSEGLVRINPAAGSAGLVRINPAAGSDVAGNAAVIAAGTGLGQAMLVWDGEGHRVVASEGGHTDFTPRSERQMALLAFLRRELGGRVSLERVLSGPGLHNIYRFLRADAGEAEPNWLGAEIRAGDPAAAIAGAGLAGRDAVCAEALNLFAAVYGGEAGDLALRCVAVGGIYIGGGIAPKILPLMQSEAFWGAFRDKGRYASFVEGIAVRVALDPHTALLGAARRAAEI